MRYIVINLCFVLAVPAGAAERLPSLKKGMSYAQARTKLTSAGWKPIAAPGPDKGCSPGREDVCERYPEAEACSGTGLGFCSFGWSKNAARADISTSGEDVDSLRVHAFGCAKGC